MDKQYIVEELKMLLKLLNIDDIIIDSEKDLFDVIFTYRSGELCLDWNSSDEDYVLVTSFIQRLL